MNERDIRKKILGGLSKKAADEPAPAQPAEAKPHEWTPEGIAAYYEKSEREQAERGKEEGAKKEKLAIEQRRMQGKFPSGDIVEVTGTDPEWALISDIESCLGAWKDILNKLVNSIKIEEQYRSDKKAYRDMVVKAKEVGASAAEEKQKILGKLQPDLKKLYDLIEFKNKVAGTSGKMVDSLMTLAKKSSLSKKRTVKWGDVMEFMQSNPEAAKKYLPALHQFITDLKGILENPQQLYGDVVFLWVKNGGELKDKAIEYRELARSLGRKMKSPLAKNYYGPEYLAKVIALCDQAEAQLNGIVAQLAMSELSESSEGVESAEDEAAASALGKTTSMSSPWVMNKKAEPEDDLSKGLAEVNSMATAFVEDMKRALAPVSGALENLQGLYDLLVSFANDVEGRVMAFESVPESEMAPAGEESEEQEAGWSPGLELAPAMGSLKSESAEKKKKTDTAKIPDPVEMAMGLQKEQPLAKHEESPKERPDVPYAGAEEAMSLSGQDKEYQDMLLQDLNEEIEVLKKSIEPLKDPTALAYIMKTKFADEADKMVRERFGLTKERGEQVKQEVSERAELGTKFAESLSVLSEKTKSAAKEFPRLVGKVLSFVGEASYFIKQSLDDPKYVVMRKLIGGVTESTPDRRIKQLAKAVSSKGTLESIAQLLKDVESSMQDAEDVVYTTVMRPKRTGPGATETVEQFGPEMSEMMKSYEEEKKRMVEDAEKKRSPEGAAAYEKSQEGQAEASSSSGIRKTAEEDQAQAISYIEAASSAIDNLMSAMESWASELESAIGQVSEAPAEVESEPGLWGEVKDWSSGQIEGLMDLFRQMLGEAPELAPAEISSGKDSELSRAAAINEFLKFDQSKNKLRILEGEDGKKTLILDNDLRILVSKRVSDILTGAYGEGEEVLFDHGEFVGAGRVKSYLGGGVYKVEVNDGSGRIVDVPDHFIFKTDGVWR